MDTLSLHSFKDETEKIAKFINPKGAVSLTKKILPKTTKGRAILGGGTIVAGSAPVLPGYEDNKAKPLLNNRLERIKGMVTSQGVYSGTGHKRIAIQKSKLTRDQLQQLGFKKSYVAIPESGQDKWVSWRHPNNNLHIHSHKKKWTVHRDEHASSQMIAAKRKSLFGKALAYPQGAMHTVTEGVPGLVTYAKGRISDKNKSMAKDIIYKQPKKILKRTKRWVNLKLDR